MLTERKRRLGDRSDGYRIRNLNDTTIALMRFVPSRVEAQLMSTLEADLTNIDVFTLKHKKDIPGISLQMIIFAALIRAYAKYPRGKRFVIGKKLYASDTIRINIVVKPKFNEDMEEVVVAIIFDPSDTLPQVVEKYNLALEHILKENERKSKTKSEGLRNPKQWINDHIDSVSIRMSGLIMFLDKHRLIPLSLLKHCPFHGTIFVTNVGSIGLNDVAHHLYNFGTISSFVGIGSKRKKLVSTENGIEEKRFIHISFTVDERICEGYYWGCIFRCVKRLLENPENLMLPLNKIRMDN